MMTYAKIERDSKEIISSIGSTESEVPSFFGMFSNVKYHFFAYCIFGAMSYFSLPQPKNIALWLFFVTFGIFNWLVIFSLTASYASLFNMIGADKLKSLELAKVIKGKVRSYGLVWFVAIIVFGLASVLTEWSILPLVIGNFIAVFLIFIVFNMDISRYQVPAMIGAAKAARNK